MKEFSTFLRSTFCFTLYISYVLCYEVTGKHMRKSRDLNKFFMFALYGVYNLRIAYFTHNKLKNIDKSI